MRANRLVVCIAALASLIVPTATRAAPETDPVKLELGQLADDVGRVLTKQGQQAIHVGKFTGHGKVRSAYGAEIKRVLIEEFNRQKIDDRDDAALEINGDYRPAEEDKPEGEAALEFLRIDAEVVKVRTGEPLASLGRLSRAVHGNATLADALGVPGHLPPEASYKDRNQKLKEQIAHPDSQISGGKVSSGPNSPFSVEILVVDRPDAPDPAAGREAVKKDGLAFVDIKRGEFYRVKITNNAPFDAAVTLRIDGLDQFVFSKESMTLEQNGEQKVIALRDPETGQPRYNYRIVPKNGGSIVVVGWFRDLKTADAFVVTEYAKSAAAAALHDSDADIGQIVVQFHACWEKNEDKPKDEGPDGRGANATGRGPEVRQNLVEVQRTVGITRDTVAVRYDIPK